MPRWEALLLDWEGTLVFNPRPADEVDHTMASGLERALAADERLRHLDAQRVWKAYRALLGEDKAAKAARGLQPDVAGALRRALSECGAELTDDDAVRLSRESYVGDPALGLRLFDDTIDALRRLKGAGVKLALVSNREFGMAVFAADLAELGVYHLLDAAIISADVGYQKPHPALFRQALGALRVSREDAAMVGNEPLADVQGARDAGLSAVWFRREGVANPPHVRPDFVIGSLSELPDLVLS